MEKWDGRGLAALTFIEAKQASQAFIAPTRCLNSLLRRKEKIPSDMIGSTCLEALTLLRSTRRGGGVASLLLYRCYI